MHEYLDFFADLIIAFLVASRLVDIKYFGVYFGFYCRQPVPNNPSFGSLKSQHLPKNPLYPLSHKENGDRILFKNSLM